MSEHDYSELEPAAVIDGEAWYDFLFDYRYDGATWGTEIRARTWEEAEARLHRMSSGSILGVRQGKPIPAHPSVAPVMGALLSLRCLYDTAWDRTTRWLRRQVGGRFARWGRRR